MVWIFQAVINNKCKNVAYVKCVGSLGKVHLDEIIQNKDSVQSTGACLRE